MHGDSLKETHRGHVQRLSIESVLSSSRYYCQAFYCLLPPWPRSSAGSHVPNAPDRAPGSGRSLNQFGDAAGEVPVCRRSRSERVRLHMQSMDCALGRPYCSLEVGIGRSRWVLDTAVESIGPGDRRRRPLLVDRSVQGVTLEKPSRSDLGTGTGTKSCREVCIRDVHFDI